MKSTATTLHTQATQGEPDAIDAALADDQHSDPRPLIAWLNGIVERRDFTLKPPDDPRAVALEVLLDTLSREFSDYRDVVDGARDAARRNAEQLANVVRSTGEQRGLVRATADAAGEAENGATRMAAAADTLHGLAQAAAGAANDAGANLAGIDTALSGLQARLGEGDAPLAEMRRSTRGVAEFMLTLARLSRQAQLLGVNASIEAAHLAEAGSRFGIVAQEVRKLSTSTRESKADVARIVAELRAATDQVAASVSDSQEATAAAGREIGGAHAALRRTARGIDEFETMVATVAGVAAAQSGALEAIGASVDGIARHADEAAAASREAADLDLDALLEQAHARVSRWTLRSTSARVTAGDGILARWIGELAAGSEPAARAAIDESAEARPVVAAVRALIEGVSTQQREILGDVIAVAVAVSRNSYAWRSIAQALDGVGREIASVRAAVSESADAARQSAEIAGGMQTLVKDIRSLHDSALELLDGGLTRVARIGGSVAEIDGFVESMGAAAARADAIMGLIETISAETDLLSLNAAIEAAHAGEQGLGFGIIAEEIRALARSTNESTVRVSALVSNITQISGELQASIGAAASSTSDVVNGAGVVRGAIATLRESFESAMQRTLDVAKTASEQTRALDRVLDNVNRCSSAADENAAGATDRGRLELAMLGSRAHAIAARRPLGTVVERVRRFSEGLAERLEASLEGSLSAGRISLERLFDFSYTPIQGAQVASLGRLFDVSRVPAEGFDPPKYATPWDGLIDEAFIAILSAAWDEAVSAGLAPVTIFVSDLNGLFYAYPRQKIGAWTNDPAIDILGNRIKRLFEDDYTLRVVRTGLGPGAGEIGPRCGYETFLAHGCDLERGSTRPWGGYVYARDTSIVCNEVATAIYARNRRHGALRVCYDPTLI